MLAQRCFCDSIQVESDCLQIAEACRNEEQHPKAVVIIEDIQRLNFLPALWLIVGKREANYSAHIIAKLSLSRNLNVDWSHRFSLDLIKALASDLLQP